MKAIERGNALRAQGDLSAAIACYRSALEEDPRSVRALYNLAVALLDADRGNEAEAAFRRLLELDPEDADALFHLGRLLAGVARHAEAVPLLQAARRRHPDNPVLLWTLGHALARLDRLEEALPCLERTVELEPGLGEAWLHLGHAYSLLQRRADAVRCYAKAHGGAPGRPAFTEALLFEKQHVCDWDDLERLMALRRTQAGGGGGEPAEPFSLVAIASTREEQLACAQAHAAVHERTASALRRSRGGFTRPGAPAPKLRIGYLSADLHEHPTAYLMAELFELHDRSRFEVIAYSYGKDDGSAMRARLRKAFDRFVDVRGASDYEAARQVNADGVHLLVDLKGYTRDARPGIAALRPAPVQASYVGYPGTMGASFIDYLVADRYVVPPEHAAGYAEKLCYLPGCYQPNDRRRPRAEPPPRASLGLPEGPVLCSFNQGYKILPAVFDAWMRVLASVPGAVLWLLDWNPWATANLRREAARRGVDPSRLVFSPLVPLGAHLARIGAADLFLDTFPCNAHTTASDALWAGVPVLTLSGETFASRVAGSLLHALGLPELVAADMAAYEARALALCGDAGSLARLRGRLVEIRETSELFDTPRYVRNLEAGYEQMWRLHAAGAPPRTFDARPA